MSVNGDVNNDLYVKIIDLKEKLRQSESERIRLEEMFNVLIETFKEEETLRLKNLESRYHSFLEDCERRSSRNEKILRSVERVESGARVIYAKTERLKLLRNHYEAYLERVIPTWRQPPPLRYDSRNLLSRKDAEVRGLRRPVSGDTLEWSFESNFSAERSRPAGMPWLIGGPDRPAGTEPGEDDPFDSTFSRSRGRREARERSSSSPRVAPFRSTGGRLWEDTTGERTGRVRDGTEAPEVSGRMQPDAGDFHRWKGGEAAAVLPLGTLEEADTGGGLTASRRIGLDEKAPPERSVPGRDPALAREPVEIRKPEYAVGKLNSEVVTKFDYFGRASVPEESPPGNRAEDSPREEPPEKRGEAGPEVYREIDPGKGDESQRAGVVTAGSELPPFPIGAETGASHSPPGGRQTGETEEGDVSREHPLRGLGSEGVKEIEGEEKAEAAEEDLGVLPEGEIPSARQEDFEENEVYPESYYEQPTNANYSGSIASNVILEEDESEDNGNEETCRSPPLENGSSSGGFVAEEAPDDPGLCHSGTYPRVADYPVAPSGEEGSYFVPEAECDPEEAGRVGPVAVPHPVGGYALPDGYPPDDAPYPVGYYPEGAASGYYSGDATDAYYPGEDGAYYSAPAAGTEEAGGPTAGRDLPPLARFLESESESYQMEHGSGAATDASDFEFGGSQRQ